jgi:hypothetical protein
MQSKTKGEFKLTFFNKENIMADEFDINKQVDEINKTLQVKKYEEALKTMKKGVFEMFELNNFLTESENIALTVDSLSQYSNGVIYTNLFTVWYKEWYASKMKDG